MNRCQRRAKAAQTSNGRSVIQECRSERLAEAIAKMQVCGRVGYVELLRAVREGAIALCPIGRRDSRFQPSDAHGKPVVIVIGDDDYASTGPAGWACTEAVANYASAAVVHGAGATASTYKMAIVNALAVGKVVLVETSSAYADAWAEAFARMPTIVIAPPERAHPVSRPKEQMQ